MGSQNFSDLSEESVEFLRNAGMTDEQISAIGLRLRGDPAPAQAAPSLAGDQQRNVLLERRRTSLGLPRQTTLPIGAPLSEVNRELEAQLRRGAQPSQSILAAIARPLEALQRNVIEPTTGFLSSGAQVTAPFGTATFTNEELRQNIQQAREQGSNQVSAFGEGFRRTDFPTTEVSLPFRVPLPGGRSLQDVDIGVKGALEATLGDAPFAIGGAAVTGLRSGLRQAGRQVSNQATRKALQAGTDVPTARATVNVVEDQAEQAVEQSVRSSSDVLPDTPIQQQAGSVRNPNLDIPPIETPTPLIDRKVTPSPAVERVFKEPRFPEGTVIDSSGRAILPAPSPAAQGVAREAIDARSTLMGITPRTLNRMTQRQPLPQPAVSNAPASAAGQMAAEDSDSIISWFGNLISSPDSVASTELTAILRSRELGRRAAAVKERAKELVDTGVSAQQAIREATSELSGELPRARTGLDTMISEEVKTALYSRIYRELETEPFEMVNTSTALTNALEGKPIPRTPGTAGQSAFSRLARVFPPEIVRGLDSKETIDALILRGKAAPEGAPGVARPPLGGVLDNPSQPKLFEIPYESRQLPRDPRTAAQREIDLQTFETQLNLQETPASFAQRQVDVSPPQFGPSQQIPFGQFDETLDIPPQPAGRQGLQGPVVSRAPDVVGTPAQRRLETEAFETQLSIQENPPGPLRKAPPLETTDKVVVEQLRQTPPSVKEELFAEAKFIGLQGLDAANFIRSNLASFDLSWLRQQALLIPGNPIKFGQAFYDSLRSVWSEDYARNVMRSIETDDLFTLYSESGADFLRPLGGEVASRWEAAEDFVNLSRIKGETRARPFQTLSEKLPWIRIAGRAHVVGTNSMNWRIYKSYYKELLDMQEQVGKGFIQLKPGESIDVLGDLKKSAGMLADMSGRGPLPEGLRKYTPGLNAVFFSVRLNIGRLISPRHMFSSSAFVRRKAIKNWLSAIGTYSSFIWAGERMGLWDVEADPRSADFMKIRIGRTRIDVWGGLQQYVVLYGRMLPTVANGEWGPRIKSTTTGEVRPTDPVEGIARFARGKAAPAAGRVLELWTGTDFKGADISRTDVSRQLQQIGLPIMGQDMYEAFDAHGLTGLPLGVISALGAGVTVHDLPRWPELDPYYQFSQNNDPQKAEALRRQFRRNPDNEARLFIRGQFTTLRNPASRARVIELMRELNLDPEDVPGFQNVFGAAVGVAQ